MWNKIITMILMLSVLAIGCGKQPFNPAQVLGNKNGDTNNIPNNTDVSNGNSGVKVIGINDIKTDNIVNKENATSENSDSIKKIEHTPNYKSYTVREVDAVNGPKDISVRVDTSSWGINDFIRNNRELAEMYLSKVRSGSQKIKYDNGRLRYYIDSNGDIYTIYLGEKIVYKRYLGAVLVKYSDPDVPRIHGKYVVGMLYEIMVKDSRATEEFEKFSLPKVGEYEVLVFNQDKINVPNTKTIYMESYKLDTRYDVNPENFYNDYPMTGGHHKMTRLVPQNWRDFKFSN